jgi:hypothetical protein
MHKTTGLTAKLSWCHFPDPEYVSGLAWFVGKSVWELKGCGTSGHSLAGKYLLNI